MKRRKEKLKRGKSKVKGIFELSDLEIEECRISLLNLPSSTRHGNYDESCLDEMSQFVHGLA